MEEDRISQSQYLGLSSHIKRMMGLSWLHMDQDPSQSPLLHFRCLLIYEARWRCYHKQVKRKDGYDANVLDDLVWLARGKFRLPASGTEGKNSKPAPLKNGSKNARSGFLNNCFLAF